MGQRLLTVQHMQVSIGDPADKAPGAYGYWISRNYERYSAWPFSSATQRRSYEEAVARYITLEGIPDADPLQVAGLITLSMEGELEEEIASRYLHHLGVTGRPFDDLRTIALAVLTGLTPP